MATDEAITIAYSEGKVPPTLRFYRWERPVFSIGSFQYLTQNQVVLLEENAIPVIRRITGGRGLLHDDELTYAVISNTSTPPFSSGIKGTFQGIAKGLIAGLDQLGAHATVHRPALRGRTTRGNPLCFDAISWYEITAQQKKLIGSAQRRWKSYFLQHGSLILNKRRSEQEAEMPQVASLISENQISLSDLCPSPPSYEEVVLAMKSGFENAFSIEIRPGELSPSERKLIDHLIREKYGRREWNLYRNEVKKD